MPHRRARTHTPPPILLGAPQACTRTHTHTHTHPDPARCPTGCLSKQHRAKPLGTDGSIGWWTDLQSYKKASTTHGSSGKLTVFKWSSVHLVSSLQSQLERSPAPTATEMLPLSFVGGLWTSLGPVRAPPQLTLASDVFCWGSLNFSRTGVGAPELTWTSTLAWCSCVQMAVNVKALCDSAHLRVWDCKRSTRKNLFPKQWVSKQKEVGSAF